MARKGVRGWSKKEYSRELGRSKASTAYIEILENPNVSNQISLIRNEVGDREQENGEELW
jgi:hypothetical protein